MFDDNNEDIQLDEFGNPVYKSDVLPKDGTYDPSSFVNSLIFPPAASQSMIPPGKPVANLGDASSLVPKTIPISKEDLQKNPKDNKSTAPSAAKSQGVATKLAELKQLDPNNKVLDFGSSKTEANVDKLKELQDQAKSGRNTNDLAAGANLITSAFASKAVNDQLSGITNKKREELDQPIKDLDQRLALEKKDPNSNYSKGLKEYIKKAYGYELKGDISGEDLDKSFMKPMAQEFEKQQDRQSKEQENEFNRKSHEDLLRLKLNEQAMMKNQADSFKQQGIEGRDYSRLSTLVKDVTSGGGSAVQQSRQRLNNTDNIFNTVGIDPSTAEKDIEKIDPEKLNSVNRPMIMELGVELSKTLGGSGSPAQGTLNKLIPNNINMNATQIQDYFTNKLSPAQQSEYVKSVLKTAARVRDTAKDQVSSFVGSRLSGSQYLRDKYPDQYKAALLGSGLPEQSVNDLLTKGFIDKNAKKSSGSDQVTVVNPDGKIGSIPKAQLEKALSQGYKLAE